MTTERLADMLTLEPSACPTCGTYRHIPDAGLAVLEAENARLAAELAEKTGVNDEYWRMIGEEVGNRRNAERQRDQLAADVAKLREALTDAYEHDQEFVDWLRVERALAETAPKGET